MSKVIEDFSIKVKIDCTIIQYGKNDYVIDIKTPNGEILCSEYFKTVKKAKEWAVNLLRKED